jgi:hypothetical protein
MSELDLAALFLAVLKSRSSQSCCLHNRGKKSLFPALARSISAGSSKTKP